eukprot:CAMPEP_0194288524 /NCGR_PEP_ID=MMETSP0169-20130528/36983_1 /TAXON_ID=218684 /ORGANISM="Corethron pennatum, Strain L29A3" /LENGTH=64 /DNA_ID=CAMNT_0039035541 /DNA_START=372 /DNA_END=562 /DNA_ORIENTATION=-
MTDRRSRATLFVDGAAAAAGAAGAELTKMDPIRRKMVDMSVAASWRRVERKKGKKEKDLCGVSA